MTICTVTDIDGDTLTIARNDEGAFTATISGEDGHRTVILTDSDINQLKAALNT